MTIDQWLKSKVDYEIPDISILGILEENGIVSGTQFSAVAERQRDLALADLYYWMAGSSSSSAGEYEADGGWQHQKTARSVVNRGLFKQLADDLRKKWGVAIQATGGIIVKDLY